MNIYAEALLLFSAGFFGGVLNSIAGGGSFITFPALLFAGVPPISANATNTFASCSGYLSGAYALRRELRAHKKELPGYILISLLGGIAGAWLLMRTPASLFQDAIRQAGLNPHLFEMANIRNQCSWIHSGDWAGATEKAKRRNIPEE